MASFPRISVKPIASLPVTIDRSTAGRVVQIVFFTYLTIIVAAYASILRQLYELGLQPCEQDFCYGRQISAATFDQLATHGISAETYALVSTLVVLVIPIFAHLLVAIVVVQRPTAWLALFFMMTFALCSLGASEGIYLLEQLHPDWYRWIRVIEIPIFFGFTALALFFPDGKLRPRWAWPVLALPLLDVVMVYRPAWLVEAPRLVRFAGEIWENSFLLIPICLIYRWQITTEPHQRRQIQLLFAGQAPISAVLIISELAERFGWDAFYSGGITGIAFNLAWAIGVISMLVSLFIAANLGALFELRVAFARTFIYSMLSILLLVAYVLSVGVISLVVSDTNSAVPALLATAAVAICFAPLRAMLQRASQRLLFGDRDEPYRFLHRFSNQIDQTDSPEALTHAILESVQAGLRVPGATLAIPGAPELSGSIGEPIGSSPEVASVQFGNEYLGTLSVARRTPNERFGDQDRLLIQEIARQTGITIHSVLQTEALQQSREQIVNAREEERRRLRRDLHDGIGPSLAALSMQIEHARDLLEHEPERAEALLDDAAEQIRDSIGSIRTIVYDLRPPALDELGLTGALRAYASRYDGALLIECDLPASLPPLPAAVEVAAYRIAQEGLTNISRHAGATHAWVRLWVERSELRILVRDNGSGLPPNSSSGVGLVSMHERTSELGGSFSIESTSQGVSLSAALPHGSAR